MLSLEILQTLSNRLEENIKGQNRAIERVTKHAQRAELNLTARSQPKGSFLFLGQPGVGKTELALQFSNILGSQNFQRFDMADFMRIENVNEFRGEGGKNATKGRIGNCLENMPEGGVLLFDEVEKAHPDIMKLFLSVLSAAILTVADGTQYNMQNYYIIFTSNIGSKQLKESGSLLYSQIEKFIHNEVENRFSPEWLDRIDEVVIFEGLSAKVQKEIAKLHLGKKLDELKKVCQHELNYDDNVLHKIIQEGISDTSGARNLKKVIARKIEGVLAEYIISTGVRNIFGKIVIKDSAFKLVNKITME